MRQRTREWLSNLNCTHVEYGLGVSLDKLDLAALQKEIGRLAARSRRLSVDETGFSGVAPTGDLSKTDYHVHFSGHWTKREFHAAIEYFPETEAPKARDEGPLAENIVPWLGRFFKSERATARVTAGFVYASKKSAVSLPLPMRLQVGLSREAEVTGMVARIGTKPEGVYEAFVNISDRSILVVLQASRLVPFRRFRVYDDMTALSTIASLFVRETKK